MQENEPEYISERISVPAEFEKVFSYFYIAQNLSARPIQKTLLPSFQTILIFSFGAEVIFTSHLHTAVSLGKCTVLGPVKQPVNYTLLPGADILVANFVSDAFYRFFGQAIVSAGLPVHPDNLVGENCFTDVWYCLKEMNVPAERVNYILNFCRPYLHSSNAIVSRIADLPENTPFNPIKIIAQQVNQSERTIQLAYKKHLGYSAKEMARYQRFLKAIELVENNISAHNKFDWFKIIDECGYYDQSQLIHDFKHYLNLSPTQFIKFQEDICIVGSR